MSLLLVLLACGPKHEAAETSEIQVDGKPLTVEIAATGEARHQGLMNRDSMPADHGMLFVYAEEQPRSFWMKDTRIPLSIAYADRHGQIRMILDMKPYDTSRYQSLYPAMYALEVNQGWFAQHGVEVGDKIEGIPQVKAE